ncbi:hypothetical protein NL676_023381 [Syzygium grande]|nr:hypothetical protein NL676_023381 [Syzygium grande]
MSLLNMRINGKILWEVKEMRLEVKQSIFSGQANSRNLECRLRASGNLPDIEGLPLITARGKYSPHSSATVQGRKCN